MKKILKLLSVAMVTMMVLSVMAVAADEVKIITAPEAKNGDIVILHTNDTHSRVDNNLGFSAVAALKASYEAAGAEVILLDAGDTLHGLNFANLEKGSSIVRLMNEAGYTAMAPGNHDFNYGTARLIELAKEMKFPLLSANFETVEGAKAPFEGHTVIEKGGKKIGIFGLSTPETAYKTHPNNVKGYQFTDPIAAAKKSIESLKAAKVDMIIAVGHIGLDESSEITSDKIIEAVDGIDLFVDGHSHTTLEGGKMVKNTLIVSTGEYVNNIGVVVYRDGKFTASLTNDNGLKNEKIESVIAEINKSQEVILSEVVGKSDIHLDGEREQVRAGETNLGNLITDAIKDATGADVVMTNGGGIRSSIDVGDITRQEIFTVLPFGNYVVTKKVKGSDVLEALSMGISSYPEPAGGFPHISGCSFVIKSENGKNVVADLKIGGEAVDLNKEYVFATNDFLAAGGDGYTMLGNSPTVNEFDSMDQIVVDYVKKIGGVTEKNAKVEGRITAEIEATTPVVTEGSYTVALGDSLWKIAVANYGDGMEWTKIYNANKDKINDSDLLYVGQVLVLP